MLNLAFFRAADTHHGLFYLAGRVFKDRKILISSRNDCHAARLPQFQGRVRVACHEHALDRGFRRTVLAQEERVMRAFSSDAELMDAGYVPGWRVGKGELNPRAAFSEGAGSRPVRQLHAEQPERAGKKRGRKEPLA